MKHKGSILHKHPSFATFNPIFVFIFLIQSVLLSAKRVKLGELVGEVEEEELEGEIVAGPSGEATIHDSGITPSPFLLLLILAYTCIYICIYIYIYIFFFLCTSHS